MNELTNLVHLTVSAFQSEILSPFIAFVALSDEYGVRDQELSCNSTHRKPASGQRNSGLHLSN